MLASNSSSGLKPISIPVAIGEAAAPAGLGASHRDCTARGFGNVPFVRDDQTSESQDCLLRAEAGACGFEASPSNINAGLCFRSPAATSLVLISAGPSPTRHVGPDLRIRASHARPYFMLSASCLLVKTLSAGIIHLDGDLRNIEMLPPTHARVYCATSCSRSSRSDINDRRLEIDFLDIGASLCSSTLSKAISARPTNATTNAVACSTEHVASDDLVSSMQE